MLSLIVALAIGQAPSALTPAQAVHTPHQTASTTAAEQRARLVAKRKAKRGARYVARTNREAAEAQAQAQADAAAKAEFERTLPARLELRRQNLQRQTDLERNRLLQQAVGAMERRAGYVYPGQSPTQGPYR